MADITLKIDSEAAAWTALRQIIRREVDARNVSLDLSDCSWATAHFNYSGEVFNQTITTSVMKGLIEYQTSFYRSLALLLKDDARVTRLTDAEKASFELVFSVNEGSSDFLAGAAEQLQTFGKAIEKMNGRQVLIAVLTLLVLYFGSGMVTHYMDNQLDEKRIELDRARLQSEDSDKKQLYDFLEGVITKDPNRAVLNRAIKSSKKAAEVSDHSLRAMDEIIRNDGGADSITVHNTKISSSNIQAITRATRSRSENIVITGDFLVTAVESDDTSAYTVRLEGVEDGQVILAELEDPLIGSRAQKAIASAEWSHKPIRVHITARQVGDAIRDAKITRAFTPRKK
ncbi:hypothetical protein [Rhizobium ruizarguesonis]